MWMCTLYTCACLSLPNNDNFWNYCETAPYPNSNSNSVNHAWACVSSKLNHFDAPYKNNYFAFANTHKGVWLAHLTMHTQNHTYIIKQALQA